MALTTGEKLFRAESRYIKSSNEFLDDYFSGLKGEMSKITQEITSFYDELLSRFDLSPDGQLSPLLKNTALISASRSRSDRMRLQFVNRISKQLRSGRRGFVNLAKGRSKELTKLLDEQRGPIPDKAIKILEELFEDRVKAIRMALFKWQSYYTSVMRRAVVGHQTLDQVKESLFLKNGNIRTGSSLESDVFLEGAMALLTERTNRSLSEGRRLGLKVCWNANPMDRLTKPECARATNAGCIPVEEMENNHGFPPRWICRCDIMMIDGRDAKLCNEVNSAIRQRRAEVISELGGLPGQKSEWAVGAYDKADGTYVKRHTASATDPIRAAGLRHYKTTSDKLEAWMEHDVPEYRFLTGLPAEAELSVRQVRALKNHKPMTAARLNVATQNEMKLADAIGGNHIVGRRPFDVFLDNEFIECKTFIDGRGQIRIRPGSRAKKTAFSKRYGVRAHTVVFDDRPGPGFGKIYYRKGFGDFTPDTMQEVSLDELRDILKKGAKKQRPPIVAAKVPKKRSTSAAQTWAQKNISEGVDYGDLDPDVANLVNKYLATGVQEYGVKPTYVKIVDTGSSIPAMALEDGGIILEKSWWSSIEKVKETASLQNQAGWWSTASEGQVIAHEYGHLRWFAAGGTEESAKRKLTTWMLNDLKAVGQADLPTYLGRYATKNQGEFYAEVGSMILTGEDVHPVVMSVYTKMEATLKRNAKRST